MALLPRLLCLPPAGTGPSLYYPWTLRHRDRLDIHPVSLPAREARIAEPPPRDLDELAGRLATELAPRARGRYALFGYSMGAVLAYEMARRWTRAGLPAPEVLFILGCNPPDRLLEKRQPLHVLESGPFWRAISDLGGTPREILDNPEALALFEPVVRNDFRICETYECPPGAARLPCPAHVFVADGDSLVDAETAAGWRDFVAGGVTMHGLEGRHMLDRPALSAFLDTLLTLWPEAGTGVDRGAAISPAG